MLYAAAVLFFASSVAASAGDRSPAFQSCLVSCLPRQCVSELPFILRLTRWTCVDDCSYLCSHEVTDLAQAQAFQGNPARIEQFYGKWAFWRLGGIQEPASVLFSLANLYVHVRGMRLLGRKVPLTHPMLNYYTAWSLVNINAWTWSTVFHTRGELLDRYTKV